jgi:hypothetical protein
MLSTTSDVHYLAVGYVAQYTHSTCLRLIEAIKYRKKVWKRGNEDASLIGNISILDVMFLFTCYL